MDRLLGSRNDTPTNLNILPCESGLLAKVEYLLLRRILRKFERVNGMMWDTT